MSAPWTPDLDDDEDVSNFEEQEDDDDDAEAIACADGTAKAIWTGQGSSLKIPLASRCYCVSIIVHCISAQTFYQYCLFLRAPSL